MFTFRRPPMMFAVLVLGIIAPATSFGAEPQRDDGIAFFEKHVRPLLIARCYSCHSSKTGKQKGGLVLDSRQGWARGGDRGTTVEPGDVDASLLIQAVRYRAPDLQMPPDRALSEIEIAKLEQWVKMGAPDPRVDSHDEPKTRSIDPSDPIAGREHWAYRPLEYSVPDTDASSNWGDTPIDRFIAQRLHAAGLAPPENADRRTLVRRLFIQLTGLPPTPDQIARFASDNRPDAVERLVDQLLSSPHFGERWGRHWLDLARYADSNGLDENFLFREAWRYRNRVIESFNADTPWDQFLTEQIAGDLLPYDSIQQRDRQRVSAGFLVIGPKVLLGNDDNQRRMDVADEQIDTIGRAVLGQTLGCARCHDHKFDPVPTRDYYALAGIMTSTEVMEKRHMLGQQRLMEQLVGLGAEGSVADESYEAYWRTRKELQERLKQAKAANELLNKGDFDALAEHAKQHANAIAMTVLDREIDPQQRTAQQQSLIDDLSKRIASPPPIPPRAMSPADQPKPADEFVRLAGQFDRLGDQVPRGFLRVVSRREVSLTDASSGRIELASWLTDAENGAGHLAARVFANRAWYHLIGRGLVRTVDNFGRTGESPSHPELLDYLATRLIENEWSIKSLVREIVTSRTFAMSSGHDATADQMDPENQLLWRANRRRLDAETFRDAMLKSAGILDLTPMESSVWYLGDQATAVGANKNRRRTDFPCRSVYLPVIRNDLPELFEAFDFADPHAATGMRPDTMVANRGLFVLNDNMVLDASDAMAARLLELGADQPDPLRWRVERLFIDVLGTQPSESQQQEFAAFVEQIKASLAANDRSEMRAWAIACQALLASSRFQILE